MSMVNATRLDGATGRIEAGIRHHDVCVDEGELVEVNGLLVPAETRTVFEAGTDVSVESGLCIVSSALRAGRVTTNDFAWPDFCHLGEFDGKRKYTRDIKPGEDPGEVVFREKRREDEMRRERKGMSRWTWAELDPRRQLTTVRRIDTDMRESARRYGRNRTIIA